MQASRVFDPVSNHPEDHVSISRAAAWHQLFIILFSRFRCKKKVPATKRFTVHRTSNVLTLSLKRFANFSGGKITKVSAYWFDWHTNRLVVCDQSLIDGFLLGCWLPRVPEHSSVHVPEHGWSCDVWPLCCPRALRVQLPCWTLLLLRQGERHARAFK